MEYTTASVIKGAKSGNTRTFKISDKSIDRDNDIIVLENMNIKEFKKNPVIMYVHSANRFPDPDLVIGKAPKIWYENEKTELFSDAQFDVDGEGEVNNVLAKKVLYKIDDGQLNMSSIGFGVDFKVAGYGNKESGEIPEVWYWRKTELHEWSVVPVPANRNASVQRSFESAVKFNLDEWKEFISKENIKGDDLDRYAKGEVEGAPELIFLDVPMKKQPEVKSYHIPANLLYRKAMNRILNYKSIR